MEDVGNAKKVVGWHETARAAFEFAQKFAVYPVILAVLSATGFVGYERNHYEHRIQSLSEDLGSEKQKAANNEVSLNQTIKELNERLIGKDEAIKEREHEIAMLKCTDNKDRVCIMEMMRMIRNLMNELPKEERVYFVQYVSTGG